MTKRIAIVSHRSISRVAAVLLICAVVFISLLVPAGAQKPDDSLKQAGLKVILSGQATRRMNKMSAANFAELRANAATDGTKTIKPKAEGSAVTYSVLNVEFKTAVGRRAVFSDLKTSTIKDAYVITAIDRFADVFVSTDAAWDAIAANPNVLRVEYSTEITAPPPPEVTSSTLVSQAVPEPIVRGGFKGFTGKNVIVAVLDTGIDFRHPDFITYDAQGRPTSRIAYLWDTATDYQAGRGSVAPVKFPNGTSIGTLYTRQQLTNELRAATQTIPATDLDGHGTACASVAAGNGNADKRTTGLKRPDVVGVAPEATLIGIRMGFDGLENSYLLNAFAEWLETVAGTSPLVVSGSFGGHYTGHDGMRVEERQLNARFPLTKKGRAIVLAAGNEGNKKIHSVVTFGSTAKLVSWTASEATWVKLYFDSADTGLNLLPTQATPLGANLKVSVNPISGQYEARIKVAPGLGGVWLQNTSGRTSVTHLYFNDQAYGTFNADSAVQSHLVGTPGAMDNAITVGSYDWNDNFHKGGRVTNLMSVCRDDKGVRMPIEIGWLSCYSSPGPTRTGNIKPEIVAPGEWFPSADAKNNGASAGTWANPDSTGFYRAMNGTSAATPYTSGIVALMFQKNPLLTLGDVKTLLKTHSTKSGLSPFSTSLPNNNWGYGKLDAAAVDRMFASF
jgi:subtilisin family serine protease